MTIHLPGSSALAERLSQADPTVVLCFCAAWCDTCKEYQPKFDMLSARHPDASFVWIDIEDHPLLLGDEDVENFPTIAILHGTQVRFLGTILPHIEHLDRLIEAMQAPGKPQDTALPDYLLEMLKSR
jgi:thiol-disulfide isomerase/thioredoxin